MTVPVSAYAKGVMGEIAARHLLEEHGLHFLEANYRVVGGEIDLIMTDADTIVFAEVKCREHATVEEAMMSVTPKKTARIAKAARCWLGEHPEYMEHFIRFDAVLITAYDQVHIPDAFRVTENE